MWISDEKGTAIRANPACLEFFGAAKEEVIGKYNLFYDAVIEKNGFIPVIKSVFEKFTKNELLQLYENIDSGKFKGAARQSNAFTNAVQGGVTTTALKAIPVETVSVTRKDAITGKNKSTIPLLMAVDMENLLPI